jgi:hypothetical protein
LASSLVHTQHSVFDIILEGTFILSPFLSYLIEKELPFTRKIVPFFNSKLSFSCFHLNSDSKINGVRLVHSFIQSSFNNFTLLITQG